ncbi:MAG: hypothetical protein NWE91_02830 [Candidatus Bathyarchaeota archaeon]|nr:hypothetical protein [Candidatus Bathyarchaeota archaeon]
MIMKLVEKRSLASTCPDRKVSTAFIEMNQRSPKILSIATNGVPKTLHHLNDTSQHRIFCVHAEERAFKDLTDENFNRFPIVSFCNLSPCYDCAKILSNSPIVAHVYKENYDNLVGVEVLLDQKVPVYRSYHGNLEAVHPDISLQESGIVNQTLRRLNDLRVENF